MSWVKVDDGLPDHPKFLALGRDRLAAIGALVTMLAYCNRYLTDGAVPRAAAQRIPVRLLARLQRVGVIDPAEDGWTIHDYNDYQPSKAEVLTLRAARSEAGRRGGIRSGQSRRKDANSEANGEASAWLPLAPPTTTRPGPSSPETTTTPDPSSAAQVVMVHEELYGSPPTMAKATWYLNLEKRFGTVRVVTALRGEHERDPNPKTIAGRMEAALKNGDRRSALHRDPTEPELRG